MNNNCWCLTLVALLSALHIAIGCRGGRILSELEKWWENNFKALRIVSGEFPVVARKWTNGIGFAMIDMRYLCWPRMRWGKWLEKIWKWRFPGNFCSKIECRDDFLWIFFTRHQFTLVRLQLQDTSKLSAEWQFFSYFVASRLATFPTSNTLRGFTRSPFSCFSSVQTAQRNSIKLKGLWKLRKDFLLSFLFISNFPMEFFSALWSQNHGKDQPANIFRNNFREWNFARKAEKCFAFIENFELLKWFMAKGFSRHVCCFFPRSLHFSILKSFAFYDMAERSWNFDVPWKRVERE